MTSNIKDALTLLETREQRAIKQKTLLKQGIPLVVIRANYPGTHKLNTHTTIVVSLLAHEITQRYSIVHKEISCTEEGLITYLLIDEDPYKIKQQMIKLEENHPLGRLSDIDIITQDKILSRHDSQQPPRRCYLCNDNAHICSRSQKHSIDEIQTYFKNKIETFCQNKISTMVYFSLISELCLHPKFGLVTPYTNGSHDDMDFELFITSALTICPYFDKVALIPIVDDYQHMFQELRVLGLQIEEAMFNSTNQVNTHKGAIFLFLLLIMGLRLGPDIKDSIQRLSQSLTQDFQDIKDKHQLTHGEIIYQELGIKGVKGFALSGFDSLFEIYVPFYQQCEHDPQLKTLLKIMSHCEDTTIIHRKDLNTLHWLQTQANNVLNNQLSILKLDQQCQHNNLSPGGSADILSLVIYLDILKNKEERSI